MVEPRDDGVRVVVGFLVYGRHVTFVYLQFRVVADFVVVPPFRIKPSTP